MVRYYINGSEAEEIRFPITEVGHSSTVSMIIENDSEEYIELIPIIEDKDAKVLEYPKFLKPREKANATFSFNPGADRTTSLNTTLGFREILG